MPQLATSCMQLLLQLFSWHMTAELLAALFDENIDASAQW